MDKSPPSDVGVLDLNRSIGLEPGIVGSYILCLVRLRNLSETLERPSISTDLPIVDVHRNN